MSVLLKIVIAEPSAILRQGLEAVLRHSPDFRLQFTVVTDYEALPDVLRSQHPDCLILNPAFGGYAALPLLREAGGSAMKCVALVHTTYADEALSAYDEQIHLFDTMEEVKRKFAALFKEEEEVEMPSEEQQILSLREKEIIICVVKGMTNRTIATKLFLSAHTVITHRRNIARKLQIHSASGLTIYAIMNKLVELSEIKS